MDRSPFFIETPALKMIRSHPSQTDAEPRLVNGKIEYRGYSIRLKRVWVGMIEQPVTVLKIWSKNNRRVMHAQTIEKAVELIDEAEASIGRPDRGQSTVAATDGSFESETNRD